MHTDFPRTKAASLRAHEAEIQDECGNHAAALEQYKEAVAILMPLVEGEIGYTAERIVNF